jgi:membrane associated rhomboid family serine protease
MRNLASAQLWSRYIPAVTLAMISLLAVCFVLQSKLEATDSHTLGPARLASLFSVSWDTVRSGHMLRLMTANLFHVNRGHLLSNLMGLLFFSSFLETIMGKSRVTIVILLSALAGTIGSLLFHIVDWMVGSSTILFGVFGGLGVLILKYRRELDRYFLTAAISWCISLLLMSTLGHLSLSHVDHGAHVGGMAAGMLSTWNMVSGHAMPQINEPLNWKVRALLTVLLAIFSLSLIKEVFPLLPH